MTSRSHPLAVFRVAATDLSSLLTVTHHCLRSRMEVPGCLAEVEAELEEVGRLQAGVEVEAGIICPGWKVGWQTGGKEGTAPLRQGSHPAGLKQEEFYSIVPCILTPASLSYTVCFHPLLRGTN